MVASYLSDPFVLRESKLFLTYCGLIGQNSGTNDIMTLFKLVQSFRGVSPGIGFLDKSPWGPPLRTGFRKHYFQRASPGLGFPSESVQGTAPGIGAMVRKTRGVPPGIGFGGESFQGVAVSRDGIKRAPSGSKPKRGIVFDSTVVTVNSCLLFSWPKTWGPTSRATFTRRTERHRIFYSPSHPCK